MPKNVKNYVFSIYDFNYPKEIIEFIGPAIFGYSFHSNDYSKYVVFSYYKELVIATVYRPSDIFSIDIKLKDVLFDKYTSKIVKRLIEKEIDYQLYKMITHRKINEEILDKGLRDKIKSRYLLK